MTSAPAPEIPRCTCGSPMEPAAVTVDPATPIYFCINCDVPHDTKTPADISFEKTWIKRLPNNYTKASAASLKPIITGPMPDPDTKKGIAP